MQTVSLYIFRVITPDTWTPF